MKPQAAPHQSKAEQAAAIHGNNLQARRTVLAQAYPMIQNIWSNTITPDTKNVYNIPPVNVGLVKGFLIKIQGTVTNPGSGSSLLTLTAQGPANLLQSVIFSDLQNYQRINTTGWHLSMLASLRQGRPFLSSTPSDSPMGFGSNWPIIKAPATIATGTAGTVYMYYWIPLAYSDDNLSGAIYMNVVNAVANLNLTFANSASCVVANTGDPTLAIYQGAGAVAGVTLTNVIVNIFQFYLDQLPLNDKRQVILPPVDLNTMYELKQTAFAALVQGQDFYIAFSNFRHFLSTIAIYNNQSAGVYPAAGTDITYWSLRSANATDLRKMDPYTWTALIRRKLMTDPPLGCYIFDTRDKPIYTTQQGNMTLVLNPSLVNTGASVLVAWEQMSNVENVVNAGSLASS